MHACIIMAHFFGVVSVGFSSLIMGLFTPGFSIFMQASVKSFGIVATIIIEISSNVTIVYID